MSGSRNLKELSDIESVRLRPGNIFGTNDVDGEINGIREVIVNSCDEAAEGYGKYIEITIERDNTTTVYDEGRGLPMGWNSELGKYNWEIALCTLYGSGKYDSSQYSNSAGLNGLGLTAMQFASEYMMVKSVYDGKAHYIAFKDGVPTGQMIEEDDNTSHTGTTIKFKPDPRVFIDADKTIPPNAFNELIRRKAMIIDGLKIVLNHCDYNRPVSVQYNNGIVDFISEFADDKYIPHTQYFIDKAVGVDDERINQEPYELTMRMAFNFSNNGGLTEVYHNGEYMYEAIKNKTLEATQKGIVSAIEQFAKDEGKIAKKDQFIFKDVEPLLVCIVETKCPGYRTFFKNQTKGAIANPFIVKELKEFVYRSMRSWLENNKKIALKVVTGVINIKEAREEADKVSKRAISKLTKKSNYLDQTNKLYDCESEDPLESELYIVEGESALTSVVVARNEKTQAAIALTGKPLNCIKNYNLTTIMSNNVVITLYSVLKCGIETKSKYIPDLPEFDISKLRYNKIILAADADIDGKHIIILVLAMLYRLTPSLIKMGKVYIAESPLYEIVCKGESIFAYSDEERDKILSEMNRIGIKESQIEIHRSKGLGENDADMMSKTTMDPSTRRLIQVKYPDDDGEAKMLAALFESVLGNDIESRRMLIDQYFSITDNICD